MLCCFCLFVCMFVCLFCFDVLFIWCAEMPCFFVWRKKKRLWIFCLSVFLWRLNTNRNTNTYKYACTLLVQSLRLSNTHTHTHTHTLVPFILLWRLFCLFDMPKLTSKYQNDIFVFYFLEVCMRRYVAKKKRKMVVLCLFGHIQIHIHTVGAKY